MPSFSSERVMSGHDALRYVSRYLGKRTLKEDSSLKVPPRLSSGLNSSIWIEIVVSGWKIVSA